MILENLFEHLAEVARQSRTQMNDFDRTTEIWHSVKKSCRDNQHCFTTQMIVDDVKGELGWSKDKEILEMLHLLHVQNRIEDIGAATQGDEVVTLFRWNGDA